jgi:hypothetical protein
MLRDAIEATKISNLISISNINIWLTYLIIHDTGKQPPFLIFQDTFDSIILKKSPAAYRDVPICKLRCMVLTGEKKQCPNKYCAVPPGDQLIKNKLQRKIKMLGIGYQIARMLCN